VTGGKMSRINLETTGVILKEVKVMKCKCVKENQLKTLLVISSAVIFLSGCACLLGGGGELDAHGQRVVYPTPTPAPTYNPYDPYNLQGRFTRRNSGVIIDKHTNLEWFCGPGTAATEQKALRWAENLTVDGGNWRLPSVDELKTLFIKGSGKQNIPDLFTVTTRTAWTSDRTTDNRLYVFNFRIGDREEFTIYLLDPEMPGLIAVRKHRY
jgi:hypothetical protein